MNLALPLLCLITDRLRTGEGRFLRVIEEAVDGGVNMVQLREKDLPNERLLDLALRVREITHGRALFLVNGRAGVAVSARADGVHFTERDVDVNVSGLPDTLLIGRSVHDAEGARRAREAGAGFLQAGHVFETGSHPGEPPRGLSLIGRVRDTSGLPVVAIGGIDATNAGRCIEAGASGVAVLSAIGEAADPRRAARELWMALTHAPSAAWEGQN